MQLPFFFSPHRNIDFGDILTPEVKARHKQTIYNLVANIVHDGEPGKGTYRVHLLHKVKMFLLVMCQFTQCILSFLYLFTHQPLMFLFRELENGMKCKTCM